MKYAFFFVTGTCLLYSALLFGQDSTSSTQSKSEPAAKNSTDKAPSEREREPQRGPIDILSDTKGVDMHPYLEKVMAKVKANWYKRIPDSARAPVMKKGKLSIGFRVIKDGKITDLHYIESSGEFELDQAAYRGISDSSPLPPLPIEGCEFLVLQFRFHYNPGKTDFDQPKEKPNSLVPCVTTNINFIGAVAITVFPSTAQVATGAKQQFLPAVTRDMDSAVTWSLSGKGCAASTCGVISADGLYTAPIRIPNPATITVTATSASMPTESGSATVTIVQSSASH
jgi:TonB family protein